MVQGSDAGVEYDVIRLQIFFDHDLGFKCEGCSGFTQPIINLVESSSRIQFIDASLATD